MANESSEERVVVREVDRKTQTRLRVAELRAETAKYRAAIRKARDESRATERSERFAAKMELQKIKANTSATEKARAGIAQAAPYMICILVLSFIGMLASGAIPSEATATASSLLVLVLTALMSNLRSIISESNGNGHDEDDDHDKPKPKPKKE